MSDAPPPIKLTQRDAELLASYSEGLLTEADARELNARLHEAPELLTLIAHHAELEEHLRALLGEAHAADRGDWFLALAELEKAADQAELVDVETLMRGTTDSSARPEPLTAHEALGALGYLAQQALRTRAGIISAAAAVVLLATAITLPLLVGEPSSNPSAQTTPPPRDQPRARPTAVATLTATDDAQWAAFNLSAGDTLYAGQRLSLTEGFAEVTTNRGAQVIFQAPASFELLDHDNAIRLHTGKLVGIVETESSKGLLVRTPRMEVVDLGTRFGVSHDATGVSLVEVLEGEVEVSSDSLQARTLTQAESIALGRDGREAPHHQPESSPFGKLAMLSRGIVEASDNIAIAPARPDTLRPADDRFVSDTHAFVFEELRNVVLPGNARVSFTDPGHYERFLPEDFADHTIPAGTAVRSYVIRVESAGKNYRSYLGRLEFDGPILGVMTLMDEWESFASLLPGRCIGLEGQALGRDSMLLEGLNSSATSPGSADWVRIQPDRSTLEFHFHVTNRIDAIRVLVAASDDRLDGEIK